MNNIEMKFKFLKNIQDILRKIKNEPVDSYSDTNSNSINEGPDTEDIDYSEDSNGLCMENSVESCTVGSEKSCIQPVDNFDEFTSSIKKRK